MSYPRWTLSACIVVFLGAASINQADEPQLLPRAGVLVLRTGRVLRGDILRVGDRYVVASGKHDEVAVPVSSVEMRCDSLADAYQRKRGLLPPAAKVADHLQLADWCLRYDLMAAAAEQLMAAQRRDPFDPANERFEKRLKLAAHRPATPSSRRTLASPVVSQSDLDEMVRGLPAGTIQQFTSTIQPLLINRCGAGSCHGPNTDSDFRLVSPHRGGALPRRFTQRNLRMALAQLDRDQPDRSPLLMMSILAHGGAEKPSLSDKDVTQLQHLAEWAYRNLNDSGALPPAVLKAPEAFLLQPFDRRTPVSANSPVASTLPREKARAEPTTNMIDPAVHPAGHAEPIQTAPNQGSHPGVDPFDPEIFNRRYLQRVR